MPNRMEFPRKKLKTELSYDLEIPLLSIYPKKMKTVTQKDLCTPQVHCSFIYKSQENNLYACYSETEMATHSSVPA